MRFGSFAIALLIFTPFLSSCINAGPSTNEEATPSPQIEPSIKPTWPVVGDLFFTGCAYLDVNGDEQIDAQDEPIARAFFTATLSAGAGFGAETSSNGCGHITIPGVSSETTGDIFPVKLKMEPPSGRGYKLLGAEEIILESPDPSQVDFLFQVP